MKVEKRDSMNDWDGERDEEEEKEGGEEEKGSHVGHGRALSSCPGEKELYMLPLCRL